MRESTVYYRNKISENLYKHGLKPLFFKNDPEATHDVMTKIGMKLGRHSVGKKLVSGLFGYSHPSLSQNILGISFDNPIGLSAGFDKNAELVDIIPSIGFGFTEVGSITGKPCLGNPKPRLWRLPSSQSLVVYYGLKNDGCEVISKRLTNRTFDIPIGISVAMTNCPENLHIEKAVEDFAKAFKTMEPHGSYITVNISCPNTSGGQPFVSPEKLDLLFTTLDLIPTKKPVFIKLSPDMDTSTLDQLLLVVRRHRIHGIICTNLTKKKDNPKILDAHVPHVGGLSGKVVQDQADNMLAYIYKKEGKNLVLIGCGGVFTAEDAYKKIKLGASLVQMITGMIFEGPQVISEINQGLVNLLMKDGFKNIHEAIGVDTR